MLQELLDAFTDVFTCDGAAGHCTLEEHDIDTADVAPIKLAPRQLGFHQEAAAAA